jgi:hypothetical protein
LLSSCIPPPPRFCFLSTFPYLFSSIAAFSFFFPPTRSLRPLPILFLIPHQYYISLYLSSLLFLSFLLCLLHHIHFVCGIKRAYKNVTRVLLVVACLSRVMHTVLAWRLPRFWNVTTLM